MSATKRQGHMDAAEILASLAAGSPRRSEAWVELEALLHELVVKLSVCPRTEDERCDLVRDVAMKLAERSPLDVVGKPAEVCRAYLKMALRNAAIDRFRAGDRGLRDDTADLSEVAPDSGQIEEGRPSEEQIARTREMLEEVVAVVVEQRALRYRDDLRRSWAQIERLVFGRATMREVLVEAGLAEDATPREVKQAQDRAYTAHKRLRQAMVAAIDAHPTWSADDRQQRRLAVLLCVRCQRPATVASIMGSTNQ